MDFGDNGNRAEGRTAERFNMAVAISVRERGAHQIPATMIELSDGGCRIAGVRLGRCGDNPIWVRIPGLESLTARVCWTDEATAGVTFEHRLYPAVTRRMAALHAPAGQVAAAEHRAPEGPPVPHRPKPASTSRREQIVAGYVQPEPGILLDKKPMHGSRSLIGLVRRSTNRVADHRYEGRFPPPTEAAMGFAIEDRPAELSDISSSGLMARGPMPASIGEEVAVNFAGYPPMTGTVIWKREDRFGIGFERNAIDLAMPS